LLSARVFTQIEDVRSENESFTLGFAPMLPYPPLSPANRSHSTITIQSLGEPRLKAVDGLIAEPGRGLGVVNGIAAVVAGSVFHIGFQAGSVSVFGGGACRVLAGQGLIGVKGLIDCGAKGIDEGRVGQFSAAAHVIGHADMALGQGRLVSAAIMFWR
jgi:hypothetical protein